MLRARLVPVLCSLLVALPAAGCAGRKAVWKAGDDAPAAASDASSAQAARDEALALFAERENPEKLKAAIAAWEKAAQLDPTHAETLAWLVRANYFYADAYLRGDDDAYLAMMDKAVSWGERALEAVSPEFKAKMRDGAKLYEAVSVVPKEGVPAMYWYASALGKWARKKGFAVLLGQKDNVKATMDRCLELAPEFFYGGPPRYFGAYYAVAPAFAGGDLENSKVSFNKSLEIEPNYLGTKVLWAENLSTKNQDEDEFKRLLQEVIDADPTLIPDLIPENKSEQAKARELLEQMDDLF